VPLRYIQRIQDHLAYDNYRPTDIDEVRRQMRVDADDAPAFQQAVEMLVAEGKLQLAADGKLRLPRYEDELEGRLKLNPRGFGFLVPDHPMREGDLFIPAGMTKDALNGDRVRVKVIRKGASQFGGKPGKGAPEGPTGRVLEVLERGQQRFAGTLTKDGREWLAVPDGRALRDPVVIRDAGAKGAKAGSPSPSITTMLSSGTAASAAPAAASAAASASGCCPASSITCTECPKPRSPSTMRRSYTYPPERVLKGAGTSSARLLAARLTQPALQKRPRQYGSRAAAP
jgi:hypothetical protein